MMMMAKMHTHRKIKRERERHKKIYEASQKKSPLNKLSFGDSTKKRAKRNITITIAEKNSRTFFVLKEESAGKKERVVRLNE